MLVYLRLLSLYACSYVALTVNNDDESSFTSTDCKFLEHVRSNVTLRLQKAGFHRELITSVLLNNLGRLDKALLVYNWPKDIYVDPYQLVSLKDQRNWEIIIDSAIDLEMPAHKSSEFCTYVYPYLEKRSAGKIDVTIPIHGRYQKPSLQKNPFQTVVIQPPDLLLRPLKNCTPANNVDSFAIVDAPCTANGLSICQWNKVIHQQLDPIILQLPVGDTSIVIPVCGITLLVTLICCVALSISAWTHQIT